jgi:hypothetical protein
MSRPFSLLRLNTKKNQYDKMMLEAISVNKVLVQDCREFRNFGGEKSDDKSKVFHE